MSKILRLETTVMFFLRKTVVYLREILQNPEEKEEILDDLYEMLLDFHEVLPEYCYGVMENIEKIALLDLSWDEAKKLIKETISICKILMQKPSIKTFQQLVETNYSALVFDTRFSESVLYLYMQKLIATRKKDEKYLEMAENKREIEYYQERFNENDIWWIAICRMPNATETILLKAIQYAKLEHYNFYLFCIEIAVSKNATDKVMLSLLERIQKESFDLLSRYSSQKMKTRLILSIFELNQPSVSVMKKAVQMIQPGDRFYYDFYHYIIFHSCHDMELLKEVQKKIGARRNLSKRNLVPSVKRLTFLLDNILPKEKDV